MYNYYQVLDVSRHSDLQTIKSAYKKLAFMYHPDKNPGNKAAEEYFKLINEAHQILSDPIRKAQHDRFLSAIYDKPKNSTPRGYTTTARPSKHTERSVYDRYGKYDWRKAPKYKNAPTYKVDKEYFKNQLYTLLTVLVISIVIMGGLSINNYLDARKQEKIRIANQQIIDEASQKFNKGKYKEAITLLTDLINAFPIEPAYSKEKEKMISSLNHQAAGFFGQQQYKKAIKSLEVLREYEQPMRLSTWKMIGECYFQTQNYRSAIHAFTYAFDHDKSNVNLPIRIGDIYKNNLNNPLLAQKAYTEAKKVFKDTYSAVYGDAFEFVLPVEKTPEVYYELFIKRGIVNIEIQNYKEAITDFNWATYLRPHRADGYYYRGMAEAKSNLQKKVCVDWKKALQLGYEVDPSALSKYCKL
ncbi:DnaJ domain-containing protein [Fulvivirga sediminis]|uniref:DnaJ domain-containing protein n=1 Tax=Fulvivirga sediminis TaxID=2803949 RepID=A0A937F5X3_9BACT|nr:DnaJ domain-containing protein [Fulvivirga sediminis]MBL3655567.1 DnaJ domain-containing protein [Fulvivirga sediminis]